MKVGGKRSSINDVFNIAGALYAATLFLGVNNSASVQPVASVERCALLPTCAIFGDVSILPVALQPYRMMNTLSHHGCVQSMHSPQSVMLALKCCNHLNAAGLCSTGSGLRGCTR
jgi:hypothetical protein